MNSLLNIGLDAGSTTLKVVVTDSNHHVIYKKIPPPLRKYCRDSP